MNIDQIRYGGCWSLELRGYKDNHLRLESRQVLETKGDVYDYLSYFFNSESMTQVCDSYDIRIGASKIAKSED